MNLTSLDGDTWTARTARFGLPILIEYARERRPITYGEWDAEIVRRGLGTHVLEVQYGHPAGTLGDACLEYAEEAEIAVPMINLMVINKGTRLPGKGANGYIREYCREFLDEEIDPERLSLRDKRAIIEQAQRAIFDFPHWADVLRAYGLPTTQARSSGATRPKRRRPNPNGWHTGPDSEAHKALKALIASTPSLVGLTDEHQGKLEQLLYSGDRVDVYFRTAALAVEVKATNASWDELHRGIFQCVKYQALLRAQQLNDRAIPNADCVLATGDPLPDDLRDIAARLSVRCVDQLAQG